MRGPPSNVEAGITGIINENDVPLSENDVTNNAHKKEDEITGTPLWKVGRMLMDSLSKGKMRRTKIFGAPLEDLPLNCQGIPKIAQRLSCFLEQYGLKEPNLFSNNNSNKKHGKLVEKFKISFDRAGDADLESCADANPCIVASLLKLWLHDLPHPLIPNRLSSRLEILIQKYERKEVYDLNVEFSIVLMTCPTPNLGVLYTVIRLLDKYVKEWYPAAYVDQLPEMFAKILIGNADVENVEIISTLVHNFREIFNERILERAFKLCIVRGKKTRFENHGCNRSECGVPLPADKLLRSNSEEKLSLQNDNNKSKRTQNLNMRRVSSHEDFSGHVNHNSCRSLHITRADPEHEEKLNIGLLMRSHFEQSDEPVIDSFQKMVRACDKETDVLLAPPPFHYNTDSRVQEEIRNAERFNPQFGIYRGNGRRKRTHQGFNIRPKVLEVSRNTSSQSYEVNNNEDITAAYNLVDISLSPTKWNWLKDLDTQSRSSISSSSSSESNSPTCEDTLGPEEPIQYRLEYSEPTTVFRNWTPVENRSSFDRTLDNQENRHLPNLHFSNVNSKILHVNKHLQWVKKKLKRFEEDFEDKFGETPATINKMSHAEYKRMATNVIFLKDNLRQLKKESNGSLLARHLLYNRGPSSPFDNRSATIQDKENALREIEKRMREKRVEMKMPDDIDRKMSYEELREEKVFLQKELLNLESRFGQTVAKNENLFRPLYERYRTVKRLLARAEISLKFRELISSDLATIDENEAVNFDRSPVSMNSEDRVTPLPCPSVCKVSRSDFPMDNIHGLSSPELMMEYKITKEEKKDLRHRIKIYDQEIENRSANEGEHCIHSLLFRYKNCKAKLKLLEALLKKTK